MTSLDNRRSFLGFWLATLTAVVLALAGWLVSEMAEAGPDVVEIGGVETHVPAGWVTETPAPGLLGVRSDPFDRFARLEVGEPPGTDPRSAADSFLDRAGRRLAFFHLIGEEEIVGGVWVEYRFVTDDPREGPVVVAGRIGFVETGEGLRSVGIEARDTDLEEIGEVFPGVEGGGG